MEFSVRQVPCWAQHWHWCEGCINVIVGNIELRLCCCPHISYSGHLSDNTRVLKFWHLLHSYSQLPMFSKVPSNLLLLTNNEELSHIVILSSGETAMQEGIYYKCASVKMTLKFHFLWSTLFWLEESVSAVYFDWLRGK